MTTLRPRHKNDLYCTASPVTQRLLGMMPLDKSDLIVLEPCAGNLDISSQFTRARVATNDIDQTKNTNYHLDATKSENWQQFGKVDWTITNPPFSHASDILMNAWEHSQIGVVMLLRLSFFEPTRDRGDWLEVHLDNLCKFIPINPRIKFRSDTGNTDSVTTAWYIWRHDFSWRENGIECPFGFIRNWR